MIYTSSNGNFFANKSSVKNHLTQIIGIKNFSWPISKIGYILVSISRLLIENGEKGVEDRDGIGQNGVVVAKYETYIQT